MLEIYAISRRVILMLHGDNSRLRAELTLAQAKEVRKELDEIIEALEEGRERPGTVEGLIEQIRMLKPRSASEAGAKPSS